MKCFCEYYRFSSLLKYFSLKSHLNCFRTPENYSCIDLILTNSSYCFHYFCVIETDLSDLHKMIVAVMKTTFQKILALEIMLHFQMKITEKTSTELIVRKNPC